MSTAWITFSGDKITANTDAPFDSNIRNHRLVDAAQQVMPEIIAKADGKFTDGERYRAIRALMILSEVNEDMAEQLNAKIAEFGESLGDIDKEDKVDQLADHMIETLNAKMAEILQMNAQDEAAWKQIAEMSKPQEAESLIVVPGPRKLALVPETTLPDTP